MRVGVVGSRKFSSKSSVHGLINELPQGSNIISGGCDGPDLWAEEAARSAGFDVSVFLPNLPTKGSPRYEFTKAFYERNRLIVKNSDILHAFVSPNRKGGTEYTIKYALKIGIPVVIHTS